MQIKIRKNLLFFSKKVYYIMKEKNRDLHGGKNVLR